MGKKIIISERQYKMITESFEYQKKVKAIIEDLDKNYSKVFETYEDVIAGDYKKRAAFEIKLTKELIDPKSLSEYIQKKYKVGKRFTEQIITDWCNNSIDDGLPSKYVPTNE